MRKLVILIKPPADEHAFEAAWPDFLHLAERMPGLLRESTSRVESMVYGQEDYSLIHELYFESLETLREALSSLEGRAAGRLLQTMTGGQMVLLIADHQEDSLVNIQSYRIDHDRPESNADPR
jgi:uncharacterized protein (TIGR02118 family)